MYIMFCCYFVVVILVCVSVGLVIVWVGVCDDFNWFIQGLKGLDGQFSQQVFDSRGKVKEIISGCVVLLVLCLFCWEYIKLYEQLIVVDGKKVWVYELDLEQVMVCVQGQEEQNSLLIVLINLVLLDCQYDVSEEVVVCDGFQWLLLIFKCEIDIVFQYVVFGFNIQGLVWMEVVDVVGQWMVIIFSGWKCNLGFVVGIFSFMLVKGIDVIGE